MDQESINLVTGIVGLFLGEVLGGGSVLAIMARLMSKAKNDPVALALGERLYNSVPVDLVRQLLRDAAIYGDKISDGVPESEKPAKE